MAKNNMTSVLWIDPSEGMSAAEVGLFKTALEANPKIEQFWLSYINALIKENQFDNAKQVLEQGKNQGVVGEKVDALEEHLTLMTQAPNSTLPEQKKSLTLSEKRKTLAEQKKQKKAKKQNLKAISPSETEIKSLLEHYQKGRYDNAEKLAKSITEQFPKYPFAWKLLGAMLGQIGKKSEALKANQRALELVPQDAEVHNNLGITFQELGRLDEAEASSRQAIALKPDYAEAHSNLGVTLQELGRLDEAEASYTQAIALKPDYFVAHHNLVELLTSYISKNESSQPIVKVDQEIKEINLNEKTLGVISNNKIIHLFYKSSNIIKKYDLDLGTELSQTFRRNSVDLNCKRHMQIFNKFNVIPKFCFGCYKVQVEPRSVLELIKLFVVFDQIKLPENNIRKCMIEMRSEISGFYKGLIYCSSLKEAYQIADYLETVIKEKIGLGLPLVVKRGCSEYPIAFPDYKEINKSGAQLMNYNEDWKPIEEDYDSKNSIKNKTLRNPSLSCLSLSDVMIIRNWIDYAKGIGDSSAQLLNQNGVVSQRVYEIAKSRLETHVWRELI